MAKNLSDDITIQVPTADHRDGILLLIKDVMLPHEPIEKVMEFTWDEVHKGWEDMVEDCIENGHCHVATNKNNEVVGARLGRILETKNLDPNFGLYDWMDGPEEKSHRFATAFNELTSNWRHVLVKNGKTCEKVLQFMTLCVRPDCGKKGIGVAITQENLSAAKAKGIDYCSVVATNWMSQRVFEKCHFREAGVRVYLEYCDESGKPIFDVRDPENPCMKWMVKEL